MREAGRLMTTSADVAVSTVPAQPPGRLTGTIGRLEDSENLAVRAGSVRARLVATIMADRRGAFRNAEGRASGAEAFTGAAVGLVEEALAAVAADGGSRL